MKREEKNNTLSKFLLGKKKIDLNVAKMESDEAANALNVLPEHLKDEAKQKFQQLTGFAKSSAQEVKKMTTQAADKVRIGQKNVLRPILCSTGLFNNLCQ